MESIQKERKFERTSKEQLLFYIEFCRQHPELLAGKNSPRSPLRQKELWAEIAANLNAMRGPTRTPDRWKENLGVWKSQLRARARQKKSEQQLTSGGPCSSRNLSEFEERALSTFGAAAVEGVPGIATLGIETSSQTTIVESSSPTTIAVGPASPDANIESSSPQTPLMWPCSPEAESISHSPSGASGASFAVGSPSNVSLGPSSPGAVSQRDMYAVVMRSIEQRNARDERLIELQIATLQAIEKMATAIETLANNLNK